ncbi:2-polyprenyl-3-methyl-6-methoxy-1,4-benzoquinone monooxygenase [Alkalilimnicola sp. S0819]|uniref:2-polyprenyl-3-methyl-6-methoxy-1,4-benzoquinone monooxygenase n=1 Tax=Alkalilimnicola sp. S0819 TaxID=2613922 RepID=UPI00126247D6|nr:2-polyprenyl-3-methyl-6-methoxy-1,4-benzoquinone monooxygenase [Alkalilimnicola sp. S0819]KAB7628160.1 2-polyprenyl-3-methyl-6-methoxy-1,4-benzoquinone monooxygenase [Alkalilimnicola sp. S0819]MPQ15046.1 2-polyprenyl-3-methyl-6-methoxy-1,4-benzoquinone monooxygenase [Alkalilimnicola sp. S0819]
MTSRHYSPADRFLLHLDQALRTVFGAPQGTGRSNPAQQFTEAETLSEAQRRDAMRLMRVNHSGEVCAQALYQGQALTARSQAVREAMTEAATEENDHLDWCEQRIRQLDGRVSRLNPFFYIGSLALGAGAGLVGDKWSLGFLAETERQVVRHLEGHLARLPEADRRSRAVVEQMKEDEARHAGQAVSAGAATLPAPVTRAMGLASRVMTGTTYYL